MRSDCNSHEESNSDDANGSNVFVETSPKTFTSAVGNQEVIRTVLYHVCYGIWRAFSSRPTLTAIAWIITFDQSWRHMLSWNPCSTQREKIRKLAAGGVRNISHIYVRFHYRMHKKNETVVLV